MTAPDPVAALVESLRDDTAIDDAVLRVAAQVIEVQREALVRIGRMSMALHEGVFAREALAKSAEIAAQAKE